MTTTLLKFPKRFEIEGVDPCTLKVKVVSNLKEIVFKSLEDADHIMDLSRFVGPMADMHEGKRCVRFECKDSYQKLSS
jgi:hypothetical protein